MTGALPAHLGGHRNVTHLDAGALDYLIQWLAPRTFVDVGCGPGGMVRLARERGLNAIGIDGDWTIDRGDVSDRVMIHDFTAGPLAITPADLAWAVGFLEHVEDRYVPNIFSVFRQCRVVMATVALPGTPGHHHVNCREFAYWEERFAGEGFRHDATATLAVRKASTMAREFVRDTAMVFARV